MLQDFRITGREMFESRLNDSHSGNMSIRLGNRITITRSGSSLHALSSADLIDLPLYSSEIGQGSLETIVHRAIYSKNKCFAIVHAHPVHTVAISFHIDRFRPIDAEGQHYFSKGIPVLQVEKAISSDEVAEKLPELLRDSSVAIIRGHGAFATGKTLNEAYKWISSMENSAKILLLAHEYEERYKLP